MRCADDREREERNEEASMRVRGKAFGLSGWRWVFVGGSVVLIYGQSGGWPTEYFTRVYCVTCGTLISRRRRSAVPHQEGARAIIVRFGFLLLHEEEK